MQYPKTFRWLSLGSLIGPILFTLAWFILGFLSPGFTMFGETIAPYNPISAQISGLGLGPTAIYMNTAFVLTGILMLAGLIGIFWKMDELNGKTPWASLVLLALTPLGAILVGFYPISSGFIHFIFSIAAFFAPVISFVVAGLQLRKTPGWQRFGSRMILGSPLTLILIVLFFATFVPTPQGQEAGVGGLVERLLVTQIFFWYAALGWIALRRQLASRSEPSSAPLSSPLETGN